MTMNNDSIPPSAVAMLERAVNGEPFVLMSQDQVLALTPHELLRKTARAFIALGLPMPAGAPSAQECWLLLMTGKYDPKTPTVTTAPK